LQIVAQQTAIAVGGSSQEVVALEGRVHKEGGGEGAEEKREGKDE
jgi:hypothetical protein